MASHGSYSRGASACAGMFCPLILWTTRRTMEYEPVNPISVTSQLQIHLEMWVYFHSPSVLSVSGRV